MLYGGIETGGTKMVCAVCDENYNIIERARFDTDIPETCMPKMIDFFKKYDIGALGISCFGPIDLYRKRETYGHILKTTKVAWAMYDIVGEFERALNVPVSFDTDVNGACLAEVYFGNGKGYENVIYFTIGTGIGVGAYINGKLVHGIMHPEGGHIMVKRHPKDDYEGKCLFHHDCLEGLACGPAVEERFHEKGENLAGNSDFIEMESYYIAQGVCNAICMYSPEKIILGGGVMHTPGLIEAVREKTAELLNGYIQVEEVTEDDYIVLPGLKDNAGVLGAVKLAELAYIQQN